MTCPFCGKAMLTERPHLHAEGWAASDTNHVSAPGTNHYEPTNDLSVDVKLVDAVLAAAKRAGLVLVDEVSGIAIPDASETIRRYLGKAFDKALIDRDKARAAIAHWENVVEVLQEARPRRPSITDPTEQAVGDDDDWFAEAATYTGPVAE